MPPVPPRVLLRNADMSSDLPTAQGENAQREDFYRCSQDRFREVLAPPRSDNSSSCS